MPLAHDVRPKTIEEFIGQEHIVGTNGPVQKMIKNTCNPCRKVLIYNTL
mgnify:CR=1 FL=1